MNKQQILNEILSGRSLIPAEESVQVFAPSNIALVKYWGKRNSELNLPETDSLSVTLPHCGTTTRLSLSAENQDKIIFNHSAMDKSTEFSVKLSSFLDLFRPKNTFFHVETESNIPIDAGLASSASGFAACVRAVDKFFKWNLSNIELSLLARLGSGSACRSIWDGFVIWRRGEHEYGMDSHGYLMQERWPELRIGLLMVSAAKKQISSRNAMNDTHATSILYHAWPEQVKQDMQHMEKAIREKDFILLGKTAENNALAMHATMAAAWPPIVYSHPLTLELMQQIWQLRNEGVAVYFTQDAGANLKLLFLQESTDTIKSRFPEMRIEKLFD